MLKEVVNGKTVVLTPEEEATKRAEWAKNIAARPAKEAADKERQAERNIKMLIEEIEKELRLPPNTFRDRVKARM